MAVLIRRSRPGATADPRLPAKANVDHPRKALGRIHGCAVYFGQPHTMLIVAQGIETTLALRTARPDLAVAATLTEASLGAFIPPARILPAACRPRQRHRLRACG